MLPVVLLCVIHLQSSLQYSWSGVNAIDYQSPHSTFDFSVIARSNEYQQFINTTAQLTIPIYPVPNLSRQACSGYAIV